MFTSALWLLKMCNKSFTELFKKCVLSVFVGRLSDYGSDMSVKKSGYRDCIIWTIWTLFTFESVTRLEFCVFFEILINCVTKWRCGNYTGHSIEM